MKPTKQYSIPYLFIFQYLFNASCTPEALDNSVYGGEVDIAVAPVTTETSKEVTFSVMINVGQFTAAKIKSEIVEDKINNIGAD